MVFSVSMFRTLKKLKIPLHTKKYWEISLFSHRVQTIKRRRKNYTAHVTDRYSQKKLIIVTAGNWNRKIAFSTIHTS